MDFSSNIEQIYNMLEMMDVPQPRCGLKRYWNQILVTIAISFANMVTGFCVGYTSPATESMKLNKNLNFEVTPALEQWIAATFPLGAMIGALAGGFSFSYVGRRTTLLLTAPLLALALCLIGLGGPTLILMGRFMSGLGSGLICLTSPIYMGEVLEPKVRGTLGLVQSAFGNFGILLAFIMAMQFEWSGLAYFGISIPVLYCVAVFFVPETPQYLISKSKFRHAQMSLSRLRCGSDTEQEFITLIHAYEDSQNERKLSLKELMQKRNLKPLSIALVLMFFQQATGVNAIFSFVSEILQTSGTAIDPSISSIIIATVNFLSTFVAATIVDKLGRKKLLNISGIFMTVTLTIVGLIFYVLENNVTITDDFKQSWGFLPVTCLAIFIIAFSLGFGPIPWLIMGEILPPQVRGVAASLVTFLNFTFSFIVVIGFKEFTNYFQKPATFWIFAGFSAISLVYVFFFVPETKNLTLDEINRDKSDSSDEV